MTEPKARVGWQSDFPDFRSADPSVIRERLAAFITDASPEQLRAWKDAIKPLQDEVSEVLVRDQLASSYSAILEYELPLDARRPDVILLIGAGVMVVELKGKITPSQADIDQASAYARDLRCYHRDCDGREVLAVLVPTRARGYLGEDAGVHISGPDALDGLVGELAKRNPHPQLDRAAFLDESAYRPLPTLVKAARELFQTGNLVRIHRACAATDPAVEEISRIIHQAVLTRSRHLILVTGVPGAGKTLVGLQTVHAGYLDDLAVDRGDGKPTIPAVFLSGNGPLVEVLQYEMKAAGGGGQTFVRGVKDYVQRYSRRDSLVPPEHVRCSTRRSARTMPTWFAPSTIGRRRGQNPRSSSVSRIAFEWCVVIGLIGTGQEIHVGEEGGVEQWRAAIDGSAKRSEWSIHAPPALAKTLSGGMAPIEARAALNLDRELRFHLASDLHRWVAGLFSGADVAEVARLARKLELDGYHLRMTRDLELAKDYLRSRYAADRLARFGLIASSKDKDLEGFGVPNGFQATKNVRVGPWYGDDEDAYGGRSCRLLETCVTEFGAQGGWSWMRRCWRGGRIWPGATVPGLTHGRGVIGVRCR